MTRAARQLELTPAAVSAIVQRAESTLQLRLFERTTRSLRLTREGEVLVEGCAETMRRWRQALDEARGDDAALDGVLRVAAPTDTSALVVGPAIAAFCAAHPAVTVIAHATDSLQDVLADALDVTVRYGALRDSTLVARRLAEAPRVLVAAPSYLASHGVPASVDALREHRLLMLQLRNAPEHTWSLYLRGAALQPLTIDASMCGDGLQVRRWAVDGHGVAFKSLFDVVDDLEAGRLVRVLPEVDGGVAALHAVLPSRRFVPARVRRFVDLLAERFAERAARCEASIG